MDLNSRLQNQSFDKLEEDSKLSDEQHELPDLPKAKKKGNNCAAGMNGCSGFLFLISMCSSIISVSIFVSENTKTIDYQNTTSCIMYASSDGGVLSFNSINWCNLIVFGTSGLGGLSMLYMYGACCRIVFNCVMGLSIVSLIAVFDLLIMLSAALFGLAVSVMIDIGRKQTCKAIEDTVGSGCKITVHEKEYDFDEWMHVAEISAWITACIFSLMAILSLFYTIAYFFKCIKDRNTTNTYENELDAFNRTFNEDDDDEQLLDPSQPPATTPRLTFDEGGSGDQHASFPPYNTGSGEGGFYGDTPWTDT